MKSCSAFRLILLSGPSLLLSLMPFAAGATDWQAPTAEELSMTSLPAVPGAAAVYLNKEDECSSAGHVYYFRVKILTEAGKKYADVELPYQRRTFTTTVANISGRTIHSDGTIVSFTGKAYDKVIVKTAGYRYHAKVFTMPDVQVGSIIEYRYVLLHQFNEVETPIWFIQNELYVRKAHYSYAPYQFSVNVGGGKEAKTLVVFPILPSGSAVKKLGPPGMEKTGTIPFAYELDIENVPPQPDEEYLPPVHSLSYRVYFQYSAYPDSTAFWKNEGLLWSKEIDKFIAPNQAVNDMASQLTSPANSEEEKARKLYEGVMALENTDFTRERSAREEKAEGYKTIKTVKDIVTRKRGNGAELTVLFVALARAAGMKAYVMGVTSRDSELFNPNVLSLDQLDDDIAIVNVGGKEQFFDPGERYCTFGQLHWKHTQAGGLRQTADGTEVAITPDNHYNDSKTIRVASLTMSEDGQVTGTVRVGYTGSPALSWRQEALKADQAEVEQNMEEEMRQQLPGGLTVKLTKLANLSDPSKQLIANFSVDGPLATATSKRLFVPVDIFQTKAKPKFTQTKREMPVYFDYGYLDVDQVSITYPPSISIESAPKPDEFTMEKFAILRESVEVKGNTLTLTRNFGLSAEIFKIDEYPELREFYGKVIRKDQEQAIMKVTG